MNCERELITAAVAATAPLTITKYNVTIEKERGKYFITTEYLWKQEKLSFVHPASKHWECWVPKSFA